MPATTTETLSLVNRTVTVAPLVLLSAADHYGRVKQARSKRVLGVLLGENNPASKTVSVTNCFAVPFEEDDRDPSVWFIDHNYIESMNEMFKKVNAREKLIGWYHTGPKLRASDLEINELFKRYTPNPLLVIIDVQPKEVGVPTDAYISIEEIKDDGSSTGRTFVHIPSEIRAEEAEEIGVEHLLRDIRDVAVGTLSTRMTSQLQSLQGLHLRLRDIGVYLDKVAKGELPVNHAILGNLQDMFNLLPGLSSMAATPPQRQMPGGGHLTNGTSMEIDVPHDLQRQGQPSASPGGNSELARAMAVKTNDQLMSIYLSSLIRAITAFHDLIENKIENRRQQEERDHAQQEEKEKRDKEERERKDKDKAEKADSEVNGAGDKMDVDGDATKPNSKSKEGGGKK